MKRARTRFSTYVTALFLVAVIGSGCSGSPPVTAAPGEADKLLLERGNAALKERQWTRARQYFSELLESYPQSALRAEAKLGVGDSYREFLAFYPTNPRADYAQMQLGMVHFNQMLAPQRDQTETKEAVREFETFVQRYPKSPHINQVRQRLREAKDRLSDADVAVGNTYLAIRHYAGAEPRYREVLKNDPEYTRRDTVYFRLAETLERSNRKAEALPYYERLLEEYEQSEHLEEARRRVDRLKKELQPSDTAVR
jgi:outer membrane protein assembly factor BamD